MDEQYHISRDAIWKRKKRERETSEERETRRQKYRNRNKQRINNETKEQTEKRLNYQRRKIQQTLSSLTLNPDVNFESNPNFKCTNWLLNDMA